MKTIRTITACRICKSPDLATFLKFKPMPKPNGFLKRPVPETRYPLEVCRCTNCGLVQLRHVIDAPAMFEHYLYLTSMSQTMHEHFKKTARTFAKKFNLKSSSLVVDIGGNDGTFLSCFGKSVKTLNIDPAKNLKSVAAARGVENVVAYFTNNTAQKVLKKYGPADVIAGTNVFAHIDDLDGAFEGVMTLLKKDGVLVMEFPYLVDLVQKNEFDTIYHEHLSYFLAKPLEYILARHGLEIFDLERLPTHGGSLRLYIQRIYERPHAISPDVEKLYQAEKNLKMYESATYERFAKKVRAIPIGLVATMRKLKSRGKRIIGYGASAKANVLLNMCGFGPKDLDYMVDSTPYKQGLYTPGTHIPIKPESYLEHDTPDYAILFIWNFKEEVLKKQKNKFIQRGGRFIVPVPKINIL